MYSSKEELLEMTQLSSSPLKKLPRLKLKKRRNQVHSPPFLSPEHKAGGTNVTALFSVKNVHLNEDEEDTETVTSEFSSEGASSSNRPVKSGGSTSKLKKSLEKLRKESVQVDASVKSIRSKLQLEEKAEEQVEFAFVRVNESKDKFVHDVVEDNISLVGFVPAANLNFHLQLAEKDLFGRDKTGTPLNLLPSPITPYSLKPNIQIQPGDCTMYSPPNIWADLQDVLIVKNNILELSLLQLHFSHHPLFSLEHVLQAKLQRAFDKYCRFMGSNNLERWRDELRVLRVEANAGGDDGDAAWKAMRRLREGMFKEARAERESLKVVLNVWKAIKTLRANQGYSSTSARLAIKRKLVDETEEKELREAFLKELLEDVVHDHKTTCKKQLLEQAEKQQDSDIDDTSEPSVNQQKLYKELKSKFDNSFKPAAEPFLTLLLINDYKPTENVPNDLESDRKKVTSTTKFTIKITCDDVFVCKSQPATLKDDFMVELSEMIVIQLSNIPTFLTLEIYEHPKGLLKKKLCTLKLNIPDLSVCYNDCAPKKSVFECKELVHYKHAGVGCGCNLKKLLEDQKGSPLDVKLARADSVELHTRGVLVYRIGWQKTVAPSADETANYSRQMALFVDRWGRVDGEGLRKWLEGNQHYFKEAYFNDILQSDFMEDNKEMSYFRLNPYAGKFKFCNMEVIESNIRLQYLLLRGRNEMEFDGICVPNRIREISFALLKDFKKRKNKEGVLATGDLDDDDDDPDALRETGKRRLGQIHSRIFQTCKGLDNNLSYEGVMDEKYLIYFEELIRISLKNFINWFRWRPKLSKPLPKIHAAADQNGTNNVRLFQGPNKIVIKISGAKNVPERKVDVINAPSEAVQPYLEVSYEDCLARTTVQPSSNPIWNETVELPLKFQHADYLNPHSLKGSISIQLYDCLDAAGGAEEGEVQNKFYLGELKIPVASLTTGLNLSGWFKVFKPPVLFGYYDYPDDAPQTKSPKHVNVEPALDETYVQLDLQLTPSLPTLQPNMVDLPSNDVSYVRDHVIKWNDLFNRTFPNKKFEALAIDTRGRTNCITRYIRPLEPPQVNIEEFDVTAEQCLRYVSLIPFTECNSFYQNVWLTTEQLLSYMLGSVIDHCVALTCFLLALKMDVYLLLGYGIPNGSTAYVLSVEYTRDFAVPNYIIYDVVYNQKFNLNDPLCPLQRVYCVINGDNIWGGSQRAQSPANLRFDFVNRKSDWWPLFDDNISAPTNFVNVNVNYARAGGNFVDNMEAQLERKLKRKFARWRPMERTNFNYKVSDAIRHVARMFEMGAMYGRSSSEARVEISRATAQYDVKGVLLNVPWVSANNIIKRVKALNVHIQEPDATEFGLSVFVYSYPGQILSAWVFIGAIFDKVS